MAIYNTSSDAANTMIRAFLTRIGEMYLGNSFNTGSGKGKEVWKNIKEKIFNNECAYCGKKEENLTIEHLVMFNRSQCGLHHPGNIVPCCKSCNKREKDSETKNYLTWEEQLTTICHTMDEFTQRKKRIKDHIKTQNYPELTDDEINSLKAVANSLYDRTSSELQKSIDLFIAIDETLVRKR